MEEGEGSFGGARGFRAEFEVGERSEVGRARLREHTKLREPRPLYRARPRRGAVPGPAAAALSLPAEPSDKVLPKTLKSISRPNS